MERNGKREKPGGARRARIAKERAAARQAQADALVDLPRPRLVLLGIACAIIIAGFIALAAGSTTLAPLLLVGGFLVAVPYALMKKIKTALEKTDS